MNRKAVILTEGSRKIGFGHLTRTFSILEALRKRDVDVSWWINGDESIAGSAFYVDKQVRKNIRCDADWAVDTNTLLASFMRGPRYDIALVDSYLAGRETYQMISKHVALAAYIDDYKRIDYPSGVIINGSMQAEGLGYEKKDGNEYLLGPQYVPIRREFCDLGEKYIRSNIERVLITFGGSDSRKVSLQVLKFFTQNYPELEKCVVCGAGFQHTEELRRIKDNRTKISSGLPAAGVHNQMKWADIAVSACGQTLYELAACGVPTIGVCVSDNQVPNIRGWEEKGFLKYAGWFHDAAFEGSITGFMRELELSDTRRTLSRLGQKLIDGKGPERITDYLLKKANKAAKIDHEQSCI